MNKSIKIFPEPHQLAEKFAEELVRMINESAKKRKKFTVALSGGSTPELLFKVLSDNFSKSAAWDIVHFFWGDERCVPQNDPESNYGMVKRMLFESIKIPSSNIHNIIGEKDPEEEAWRYSEVIKENTGMRDGLPRFDMIVLGLGEDGHTASIFPDNTELFESDRICEVAVHPVTSQKRITVTGKVINNADYITFLVTGKKKAGIVKRIIEDSISAYDLPASFVIPVYGNLNWYVDKDAAGML